MIVLSGADLVLPDRLLSPGTVVLEGGRIVEIRAEPAVSGSHPASFAFRNHYIAPGFVDVHVHGLEGHDTVDPGNPVADIAERLPRYGVTAFCPTTVACPAKALRGVLEQVGRARGSRPTLAARVLPAHLESNFINPEFRGAQPLACLVSPRTAMTTWAAGSGAGRDDNQGETERAGCEVGDILAEIERAAADVGIVTLAPELDGSLELIAWLTSHGHQVSLGHSAATYEQAGAALSAGARRATHLFNRMPRMDHRAPGLVGAVLEAEDVAAELVCDGVHVHPAVLKAAISAKRPSRILAITDGTAVSGLPSGARATLGGQTITARDSAAWLADGTLAGSIATMDEVFRTLVERVGVTIVDAVTMCSTTPAREMGMVGYGVLAPDAPADLVILDAKLRVVQTYIGGQLAYSRGGHKL